MPAHPPILILGGDGLIGSAMTDYLSSKNIPCLSTTRRADRTSPARPFLDLATSSAQEFVDSLMIRQEAGGANKRAADDAADFSGGVIVNAAAIALIQKCADDPIASRQVNVTGTVSLAKSLVAAGWHFIHLSTDRVFDGSIPNRLADSPYCPITEYGKQKAQAEAALLELGDSVGIVRLTKVFGRRPAIFVNWIQALNRGETITPFSDMTMAPTCTDFVCRALHQTIETRMAGILQISGPKDESYAVAAKRLAERLGIDDEKKIRPVSCRPAGFSPQAAPPYTSLDTSRLQDEFHLTPPSVDQVIAWTLSGPSDVGLDRQSPGG